MGVAANPLSGALDFMSSAFEGMDASSAALLQRTRAAEAQRMRLPRAIGGDRRLPPFERPDGHGGFSDKQVPTLALTPETVDQYALSIMSKGQRLHGSMSGPPAHLLQGMGYCAHFRAPCVQPQRCAMCDPVQQPGSVRPGSQSTWYPGSWPRAVRGPVQARIEALGQALLRRCQEGGVSALGLHLRGRRAQAAADAYEEHLVLHGDLVALLTNRRLLCLRAPGFAALHVQAEAGSAPIPMSSVPVGELKWAVEWQVSLTGCITACAGRPWLCWLLACARIGFGDVKRIICHLMLECRSACAAWSCTLCQLR